MFYAISKALAICALSTNGNLATSLLWDTLMPIGAQMRTTEYPTLGYAFQVHGGLASWTSHKQSTVSNSTMQTEYMALSDASREAVARAQFLQELNISSMPLLILSDSETALDLADGSTVNHSKSKHIDIKYHQVRHYIQEGKVEVSHIASEYQIADIFTKALGPQKHNHLVQLMGMRNSHELQ